MEIDAVHESGTPSRVLCRLGSRVLELAVPSGSYSCLKAIQGGVLWKTSLITGENGNAWAESVVDPPRPYLQRFGFASRTVATIADSVGVFTVSGDGSGIVLVDRGRLRVLASDQPVENSTDPVDLDRIRVSVDPVAGRVQGYHETWRLQLENFHLAGDRHRLVDGTLVTQPKYAFRFDSLGLGLENRVCVPTIELWAIPQDFAAGRDPHLDTAVDTALAALATWPAARRPTESHVTGSEPPERRTQSSSSSPNGG